jgi:hypothetical protein
MYNNLTQQIMKKLIAYSMLLVLLASFSGCWEKTSDEATPAARKPATEDPSEEIDSTCGSKTVDFLAGQNIPAGTIEISNDLTNLYVTFNTTGDWKMMETHLYVGSIEGLPKTSTGNPKIGNFPYKDSLGSATTFTYTIPLSSLGEDQCFVVAAHASVATLDGEGNVIEQQTAWGAGSQITEGGSWATYTVYCPCDGEGDGNGGGGIGGN